jgi:hypothetical protein
MNTLEWADALGDRAPEVVRPEDFAGCRAALVAGARRAAVSLRHS